MTNTHVKFFSSLDIKELEEKIEKYLDDSEIQIKDIKLSIIPNKNKLQNADMYIVLIIFDEVNRT